MSDDLNLRADESVAADPPPEAAERPSPDDMVHVVVLNGSITADWDTGPWRGEGTSRFIGGFGHSTY